ncbi:antitoxin VbhA family protein [Rhizobium johnstonii]|uniref:antitoxin VbhA family protein n=1 Tax=Rhizobium johnstonii TaxID=3019933 RepID=UPI003F97FD8C
MKPIYLDWSDAEGVSFNLRTSGLWPFEVQEISAAFVAAGYVGHGVSHFVSTTQPNPGGPHTITDALEAIGYKVEHQGELGSVPIPPNPFVPTPEQMVGDAVANARLDGYKTSKETRAIMEKIAHGEMSEAELDAWEAEQVEDIRAKSGMTPEQVLSEVEANARLESLELDHETRATVLKIARGEMSADEAKAWRQKRAAEAVARERRRQVFEAVDKIEPFAAIQPTEEVAAIRAKWIAGEITDEEAIASIQAMLDEYDGRKPH